MTQIHADASAKAPASAPHARTLSTFVDRYGPDYCYQMVGPGARQRAARARVPPRSRRRRPSVRRADLLHVVPGAHGRPTAVLGRVDDSADRLEDAASARPHDL